MLAGRLKGVPWDKCVLHYRYFYDPPEFLTVLKGEAESGFHIGYFRWVGNLFSCNYNVEALDDKFRLFKLLIDGR